VLNKTVKKISRYSNLETGSLALNRPESLCIEKLSFSEYRKIAMPC
jgi:hypothetical protein